MEPTDSKDVKNKPSCEKKQIFSRRKVMEENYDQRLRYARPTRESRVLCIKKWSGSLSHGDVEAGAVSTYNIQEWV